MAGTPSTETLPRKTTLTIVSAIVLMSLLPHIPALQHFRGFEPTQLRSSLTLHPPVPGKLIIPAEDHTQATAHDKTQNGQITKPSETSSSPYLIIPPGSMDVFFAALRRTESKQAGAVTRILHYGDSPTTADSITADVRALLQQRFGDAGHGFVLIAKPWAWYGHRGIKLEGSGWHIAPASQAREMDGIHGLGGVSFRGQTGATSTVDLPDDLYTHAVVYYLAQPDGGSFKVQTKGRIVAEVDTNGPEKKPGFAEFSLPAGTGSVNLLVTSGHVRLFGYRFDKDSAGVEYSSLGINGAQIQMALRYFEVTQWTENLRHEHPDLLILNYGTNESVYPAYIEKQYPAELRQLVVRLRAALPNASILLMSPMDRGVRETGGSIVTPDVLPRLVEIQQQIAAETGCAFFNTFEAMGGPGTMARWYESQPRLVSADFMHPLPAGAAKVGALFERALMSSYEQSKQKMRVASSAASSPTGANQGQ